MKEKKRYILVKAEGIPTEGLAGEKNLRAAAYDAAFEWLGDRGASEARIQFIRAEPVQDNAGNKGNRPGQNESGRAPSGKEAKTGGFWLKCSTKALEDTVAALALKRFHQGKDCALRVVKVAGSVPRNGAPGKKS